MKNKLQLIGLGTAAIGRPHYINLRQEEEKAFELETFKAHGMSILEEAYAQGIRYFDTAPGYGMAEQLLLDWVTEKRYQDVEIATKWGYTYVANFDPEATAHEIKEHSLDKLNEQWQQSQKLHPYLSGYQIHSATFESGIFENADALDRLWELKNKNDLLIGLTSSGVNQKEIIEKAIEFERDGRPLFDLFQVTYNVLDQSVFDIIRTLTGLNKRVVVKEALANGRIFPNLNLPHYADLYRELSHLAEKYKVGIDAIALRFCMDSITPFMVLSGASDKMHISDNLKANDFTLREKEVALLKTFNIPPKHYWQERSQLAWN